MATIHYSVMGEGRGHATRARTLTEYLRQRHKVVLYAGGDAFEFLAPIYDRSDVEVREIPSLRFAYRESGRVSFWKTLLGAARFVSDKSRVVGDLAREMRADKPDLVLTDFEPLLPRAARKVGVPYVSFDHQHFMVENDLSSLPWALRMRTRVLGWGVRANYRKQAATIVSSFYAPGLRSSSSNVYQVRAMIRPDLQACEVTDAGHLVAYLRPSTPDSVVHALRGLPKEVRVYGRGEQPRDGNLSFCPISESGFMTDLASCSGVVCAAGNQLLGECLFLGKPVLALPEAGQDEQLINAHFLAESGHGFWCKPKRFAQRDALAFLRQLDRFRGNEQSRWEYFGTRAAVEAVEECLDELTSHDEPSSQLSPGQPIAAPTTKAAAVR